MSIRVCVAGATGWAGQALTAAIVAETDFRLVGAVSRTQAGKRLREVGIAPSDVTIRASVAEALEMPSDVLVEYTSPQSAKANVMAAISRGVHVVIGTSGLTTADFTEIDRAARERKVGVVAAGNFAITSVLLQRFACEAAKHIDHWEIIDYAEAHKPDAPSGTARELAYRLSEVRRSEPVYPIERTIGEKGSRGATIDGSQVHSVRLPSYMVALEVIFGSTDERLTLRYDAGTGAEPYVVGALLAIRKVGSLVGLVRGLDRILD